MKELVLDLSRYDKGINLSRWKNRENNPKLWGVIIKLGGNQIATQGRYKDSTCLTHMMQAIELGLHIGFYYYTDSNTVDAAKKDAEHFCKLIDEIIKETDGYCDLPCYMDVEEPRQFETSRNTTDFIKAFCDVVKDHGYYPGIYTYGDRWLNHMYRNELYDYANWIAWWRQDWPSNVGDIGMWQQGAGNVDGNIVYDDPNWQGYHDIDWCVIDYPSRIRRGILGQQDVVDKPIRSGGTTAMGRASDVINAAYAELGYYAPDDPEPGSKYARWLADLTGENWLRGPSVEIAWCCCFASYILNKAGVVMDGFPTQNTDVALNNGARKYAIDKRNVRYGDVVIFNWDWNNTTDHIGFATGEFDGSGFPTIEGNVGNAVKEKYRQLGNVAYVLRPPYTALGVTGGNVPSVKAEPKNNRDGGKLDIDGVGGWNTVIDIQHQLKSIEDGVISGQSPSSYEAHWGMAAVEYGIGGSSVVAKMQSAMGMVPDGQWDKTTSTKLQQCLAKAGYSITIDGAFGRESVKVLQHALNDGTFLDAINAKANE